MLPNCSTENGGWGGGAVSGVFTLSATCTCGLTAVDSGRKNEKFVKIRVFGLWRQYWGRIGAVLGQCSGSIGAVLGQ